MPVNVDQDRVRLGLVDRNPKPLMRELRTIPPTPMLKAEAKPPPPAGHVRCEEDPLAPQLEARVVACHDVDSPAHGAEVDSLRRRASLDVVEIAAKRR